MVGEPQFFDTLSWIFVGSNDVKSYGDMWLKVIMLFYVFCGLPFF